MMQTKLLIISSFILLATHSQVLAQAGSFGDTSLSLEQRVNVLMTQLTISEKIDFLCASSPGIPRLAIPAYDWWSEALHGVARNGKATVFPKPIALGSTWDPQLVRRIATAISDEARAKYHSAFRKQGYTNRYEGLTFFSPTLNIARDPRWGRTSECFSEDPLLTGLLGTAFVQGLQGDDPRYLKLVATPKHFVANNEEDRRNEGSAEVDEVSLREYYFPAFQMSVEDGMATSVMGAYNALNGVPCCANPFLLTHVLRGEWGFEGVVMSDGSAIQKIFTHHRYATSPEEAAAVALLAGCDMSLRDEYREGLAQALEKTLITEQDIDVSLRRVLTLRFRLGMFDDEENVPYSRIPETVIENEAHRKLALEAARKSIVLLKNQDHILPLNPHKVKRVALIGNDFHRIYYGDYSGQPDHNLSLYDALQASYGQDIDFVWVPESTKEETVTSQFLIRGQEFEYDGKMGLTGEYFANGSLLGDPIVIRHDNQIVFSAESDTDTAINRLRKLSARWTTSLAPPVSGNYQLVLYGEGPIELLVDGKSHRKRDADTALILELPLQKGKLHQLQITVRDLSPATEIRFNWKLPSASEGLSPEIVAAQTDAAIIFLRDDAANEGQDRQTLAVQKHQRELIETVSQANSNTVLAFGSSAPLLLSEAATQVKALLNIWIGGQGEAQAIVDVIFGKVNPSGKNPVTFYVNEGELPPMDSYAIKAGRSYQYFKGEVLYPFGFGLSYTTFSYEKVQVMHVGKDSLQVVIDVCNTGDKDGEEVVQCYASCNEWQAGGLKRRLVGFQRIAIPKGETKIVTLDIPISIFKRWDSQKHAWGLASNQYQLEVGGQSIPVMW